MEFEALLNEYLADLQTLQRDYRENVLAIDIPAPQRQGFVRDFERAYAASVAETRELNADFERVELEIAKTIFAITDLIEQEGDAVTVGSDGRTLLFANDAAADEYNASLKALERITAEESIVTIKTNSAFRRRVDSLKSTTTGLR